MVSAETGHASDAVAEEGTGVVLGIGVECGFCGGLGENC